MKKQLLLLACSVLFTVSKTLAQNYVPVATTGYTLDAIAENTTAVATTYTCVDGSDYIMYSQYYGTLYSTSATGLPNNGLIASGTKTFQLQPYTANNVLYIQANLKDSLTLTSPAAYPSISLLGFATEGAATLSITVRFTDNSTQVFSSVALNDWFSGTAFYSGFDRAGRGSGTPTYAGSAGNPHMYTMDLAITCANQGKPIKRIIIQNNSTARACIFAASANLPLFSVTASTLTTCSGGSVTLSATGMSSYTWQPVGGFAGSNSGTVIVTPTTTTTYSLDGVGASSGCPAGAIVTINSAAGTPTLVLSNSTSSTCLGTAVSISASGAVTYTLSNGAANGGTFVPTGTAVYTVSGANGCGISSAQTTINIYTLPISASVSSTLVCAGTAATLSAGGATTYTWMPGSNSATNYIVSPTAATIYTVTGKTGPCIGTNTITISTKPNPTLNITVTTPTICNGGMANLTVTGNAVTYTWSVNNQTVATIAVTPTNTSAYSVVGTGTGNCTGSNSQVIIVYPLPVITASVSDDLVCVGGPSTLTAMGGVSYSWGSSGSSSVIVVNPTSTSNYTVTGQSSFGCANSTVVTVNVFNPVLSLSTATAICKGSNTTLNANGMDTYQWSTGSIFQSITVSPTVTTTYTVGGSSTQGIVTCTNSGSIVVTVNPNPTVTAAASPTSICKGQTAVLTAGGAITYTWAPGTPTVNATATVMPSLDQTYTVTGVDANGCQNTASVIVKVFGCVGIPVNGAVTTNLVIYPNPSNGEFTISADQAIDLQITNELGQPVKTISLSSDHNDVKLSNLASGVYFITGKNENGSVKQKIIITK